MKFSLLLISMLIVAPLTGQNYYKVTPVPGESVPEWANMMYTENPNVWAIDDAYRAWRRENPYAKTTFTQYYKKWRRTIEPFINNKGHVQYRTTEEEDLFTGRINQLKNNQSAGRGNTGWTVLGPIETFNTNTGPSPLAKSSQANIYCIDQSHSHPDVIYCGTEGSEIFKSVDRGESWTCISRNLNIGAVGAIEVHPTNPEIVFAGEDNSIWKSMDGGVNWTMVLTDDNMWTNEILINPAHDSIVLAATFNGLYRSTNSGTDWIRISSEAAYDIEWMTANPSIAFLVGNDPQLKISRFYKSHDAGATWEIKDNGWYFSDQEGRTDGGARLAVTNADSNRIYAVLIGEAKTDDSGFIGIWRSDDAGESWYMPNPPAGGPWNETDHPNMATIGRTGGYHQGFYNLGFDASDSNPDHLLAGFLSLWNSTDGGYSFTCFGGYCGNDFNYVHPDCQEIEINGDDVWMTSDGGIEYSNDFFATHYARNRGITSSDYWGFGTGWNEDILVGGRYHNGNSGWHENWMPGEYLSLGGGEAATGYVNPGEGRITYFSDIGSVVLPELQNGYAQYSSIGKYPNESYYDAESGEMEWDPISWNTFYVTQAHTLWKTIDGGKTFDILFEFGSDPNARALSFEISRSNPEVFYLFQRDEYSWDPGLLWKSSDAGNSWTQLTLPQGYARRALLAVDAEDENRLWIAYPDGGDGEKIFTSFNGGDSWENITTNSLNGEHITSILHQGGTDGGLYIGTFRTVWFRDDTMNDWLPYNEGLPAQISTCILRPFYRDHKIRLGAYGKGIWEAPFAVPSKPVAQPMIHKRHTSCPSDTIRFDDFSMLSHDGATWQWEFPGGTPSASSLRNPKVVYDNPGTYDVTLTVSNPFGISVKTIAHIIEVEEPVINETPPVIDFSSSEHFIISNPDGGITWQPVDITACDPDGNTAYFVENYTYSSYGHDELILPVNMDLSKIVDPVLSFKVSYAPYFDGNFFIDSLKVLLSNNCQATFQTIFRSGGAELSTTTSGIGPDSLYEYNAWKPEHCEEWREVFIDLAEYEGQYVTIKFLNQSGYGNNMYLDDIFLEGMPVNTRNEISRMKINIHPNPTSGDFTIANLNSMNTKSITVLRADGTVVLQKELTPITTQTMESFSLQHQPAGIYFIEIGDEGGLQRVKLVKM